MKNFIHLHIHSQYSLLDSACRIKQLVRRVKELGQTAAAITDTGNMFGAVEFYSEAKKEGIKPIIGCEVKLQTGSAVLLCENSRGYGNLVKLVSHLNCAPEGCITSGMLKKHSGGLICIGLPGGIPGQLLTGNYAGAKETALEYENLMGAGNFFLEVQNHGTKEDRNLHGLVYRLSHETGIPVMPANDVHYINKEDVKIHRILSAIQKNITVNQIQEAENHPDTQQPPDAADRIPAAGSAEFYLKSYEEMNLLFDTEVLQNTVRIAERCNFEFEFGKIRLPKYTVPKTPAKSDADCLKQNNLKGNADCLKQNNLKSNADYLKRLCFDGLKRKYGENWESGKSRMEYELSVIDRMGYTDYYLIVWDYVSYAKSKGIPVGPGRGSGAGSLAAYCIGITGIDPIKHNLLFERFLNPGRVSMPDFDIDFCIEGRQEVIDYVINRYGQENVAQIVTFGTLAARGSVRDAGRAMGLPYGMCDAAAKMIPYEYKDSLKEAVKNIPELKRVYGNDRQFTELLDTAMMIEGLPKHISTHAAGVVIADEPICSIVPVTKSGDITVTQYEMSALENLGLVKMDFLGLRNLTVIRDCLRNIGGSLDIETVPFDDRAVYAMLGQGRTAGVFQMESEGVRKVLMRLKPENIEDIIAVISLYRPGPMDSIPKYIEGRHSPHLVTYKHPLLKDILEVTYGCTVYQEQVMEICKNLAGYSYGKADLVRRAMAKKKHGVMEDERNDFISGCVNSGIPSETASEIFGEIAGFASYAFNKSHAAAYAYIAYRTAYLKCHYFKPFMAALMTSVLNWKSKLNEYISECRNNGVEVYFDTAGRGEFYAHPDGIRFRPKPPEPIFQRVITGQTTLFDS